MIISILGYPGSGKRTLAAALEQDRPALPIVRGLREHLEVSASETAKLARSMVDCGHLIPDSILGTLLAEVIVGTAARPLLVIGMPRNLQQMETLRAGVTERMLFVHLRASRGLLDDRLRAVGKPPNEEAHPGALARLDTGLIPLLAESSAAGTLHTLDAASTTAELVASVRALLDRGDLG